MPTSTTLNYSARLNEPIPNYVNLNSNSTRGFQVNFWALIQFWARSTTSSKKWPKELPVTQKITMKASIWGMKRSKLTSLLRLKIISKQIWLQVSLRECRHLLSWGTVIFRNPSSTMTHWSIMLKLRCRTANQRREIRSMPSLRLERCARRSKITLMEFKKPKSSYLFKRKKFRPSENRTKSRIWLEEANSTKRTKASWLKTCNWRT